MAAVKRPKRPPIVLQLLPSPSVANGDGDGDEDGGGEDLQPLIPGLPDDISRACLSNLRPSLLYSVCHTWRRLLYSPSFPPFLSLYALLTSTTPHAGGGGDDISFACFDRVASTWSPLPSPPLPSDSPILLRHPSFLSRLLPLQSVASGGHVVIVAASTSSLSAALPRPLVFHLSPPRWLQGPPLPISPRRWCIAGSANGSIVIVGGLGSCYDPTVARSAARWEPLLGPQSPWVPLSSVPDSRFSHAPGEAVCYRGSKLCMVNLRGRCAKQGAVYDIRADRWEDMPPGLLSGWTGPAAAAASSYDDDDENPIYVVDEVSGELRAYDWSSDSWNVITQSDRLKGAVEMAAEGGRVCVVCGCGETVAIVDAKSKTPAARGRTWFLQPPRGKRVLSLHILQRISSCSPSSPASKRNARPAQS